MSVLPQLHLVMECLPLPEYDQYGASKAFLATCTTYDRGPVRSTTVPGTHGPPA